MSALGKYDSSRSSVAPAHAGRLILCESDATARRRQIYPALALKVSLLSKNSSGVRSAGAMALVGLIVAASVAFSAAPASATTYPTWADVVAARQNQAATQAAVAQINALLVGLNDRLQSAEADAAAKGAVAYKAQQAYFGAVTKQQTLQTQVDAAKAKAKQSQREVAEYAEQLARSGGGNDGTTWNLFLNGKTARNVLDGVGAVGQLSHRQGEIYQRALAEELSVQQLNKQAHLEAGILAQDKKTADEAEAAANQAAAVLQDAVTAQTAHQQALTIELAALTTQLTMTEVQYAAGVAAAEAANGAGRAGVVDSQGWALPTAGRITSPWGYRFDPAAGYSWRMHYGDDIADGCLQPIYAAHAGTVTYVGPYGDIGNQVVINNGGGISTAYGHIASGKTYVRIGQQVSAGQNIARTGSTGISTGCHLYFQVFVNGNPVDPVPFMRDRGITIG
jgi:murein DD-endopeptidase MepM/ murein hydrolase activator NlpD